MSRTTILLLVFVVVFSFAWFTSSGLWNLQKARHAATHPRTYKLNNPGLARLRMKATEAKTFIRQNGYNTAICMMIDMSLHSGQNRFFVYDLLRDTIKNNGLVTHGRCNENWLEGRKYGNKIGCGCTSLGKYKIGNPYNGRFGLAYKLHGLEKTNNNAFARFVVLHSHECVPESEVKDDICQSDGCPTVSPNFLQYLKPIIEKSNRPVLLWIYN
jgi:hypothetical protein